MVGKNHSPGAHGNGINLEMWFPDQDEVAIFLESSYPDPEEEQFYETCLFSLFAARQVANSGPADRSLALVLRMTDTSNPLEQALERLDSVRVTAPHWDALGRKGFACEFRPGKRAFFKLHLHGFGMMGRGTGYYAPTATLALLYWLLDRRKDDPVYQHALAACAENVGIFGARGAITVTSQADMAMQVTATAWEEARQGSHLPDRDDLPDDVRFRNRGCRDEAPGRPSRPEAVEALRPR